MSESVLKLTKELIERVGAAHADWAASRITADGGEIRMATHIALRALARVFCVGPLLKNKEAEDQINAYADSIEIPLGDLDERNQLNDLKVKA